MDFLELAYDYPPEPQYGMGLHVAGVARGLAACGHRVCVVTRNTGGLPEHRHEEQNLQVIRCAAVWDKAHLSREGEIARTVGVIAGQFSFCREMLQRLNNADVKATVIHNHSHSTVPLACELSELWGIPLVSTIHVLDVMLDQAQGSSRPRSLDRHVIRALEAEGLKRSRVIVAPTEAVARALVREHPSCAGRIHVLPHPHSIGSARVKTSYEAHLPFRILYVGRLISYKGVSALFEALGQVGVDSLECWVVGSGVQQLELERLAAELGLSVRWLGRRRHREVLQLYAEADVLVVPSLTESYGLVLQEGMHAGLPVVATALDVFTDRIDDGVDGMLVPIELGPDGGRVDGTAMANALRLLMSDQLLRERLGEAARRRAGAIWDTAEYAGRLSSIIAGVLT